MQTEKVLSQAHIDLCEKYGVDPSNVPEVHSFEAACEITGDDPTALPIVDGTAERHKKHVVAGYKLAIIAEAIKQNQRVDYTDMNQRKVNPMFEVQADQERPSGFGLSCGGYDYWCSYTRVGVRLCFPGNYDAAIFFGKHFIELHKDFQLYT